MFGKRNRPVQPEQPPQRAPAPGGPSGGGPAAPSGEPPMPWQDDPSFIACNLASGNLANNLAAWVEHDGRVHAETYVAAAGAIAGYAAQQTLKALNPDAPLQVVKVTSGETFLFGDPLNDMLFARTEAEANGRVWPRAASAAMSVGLPLSRTPALDDMFAHVTQCIGGPKEGRPSTEQQPIAPARQLLALFWPQVARLLSGEIDEFHRRFGPVPTTWWCAVTAFAVSRPVIDVKDVLDPAITLRILMESAIYASKLTRL
jgi:hypothetical protein